MDTHQDGLDHLPSMIPHGATIGTLSPAVKQLLRCTMQKERYIHVYNYGIDTQKKFDVELLLGQISYSQKADIYNLHNGYPVQPKRCSTLEKSELPKPS